MANETLYAHHLDLLFDEIMLLIDLYKFCSYYKNYMSFKKSYVKIIPNGKKINILWMRYIQ